MSSMSPELARALAQQVLSAQQQQQAAPSAQEQAKAAAQAFQAATPQAPEPLKSQVQLQRDSDAQEAELEQRLRAQDEQEVSGQPLVPVPASIGQPMPSDPNRPEVITSPDQAATRSADVAAAAHADADTNAQKQRDLAKAQGQTQASIERDNQGNVDHLANEIANRHDHLAKVQMQVEQQQEQAILNYRQVNDEMMKMAVVQPKDIFGAAGVNSMLGRIAVFLGGAGTNGFGPNTNLQYIEQLADRNIAAQKQRYEMLSKVGEGQRTLYGMLNAKLSNAVEVDATLKNMTLEAFKANTMAVAGKYSDQTTRQAAQGLVNQIDAKQAELHQAIEADTIKTAQQNMQLYGQQQANAVKAYAAQVKATGQSGRSDLLPVAGFVGGIPKTEHARVAKMVGGSRVLVDGLNHMQQVLAKGGSLADVRKYFVDNAILFKGARDFLETGTRIEAGEEGVINALKTNDREALFRILVGEDPLALKAKIEESRRAVVAATYQQVKAAAPRTAALDSKDPVFGPYNPRTYKGDPQEFFTKRYSDFSGTTKGQALLRGLKTYQQFGD